MTNDPRAHPDRVELTADKRDLLVRYRGTASRAEWVSAEPLVAAAIWCGSSPGAEHQVLWTTLGFGCRSRGDAMGLKRKPAPARVDRARQRPRGSDQLADGVSPRAVLKYCPAFA